MTAGPLIPLAVATLAGAYTAGVYALLDGNLRGSERLGFAIIAGTLLLATANNFLTAAVGSRGAAWAVLAIPILLLAWQARAGRWRTLVADLQPTFARDAAAATVCGAVFFAIAHTLVRSSSLGEGGLHPDLPWHIGRVAQQAFLGHPGAWPYSPLAFPSPLPFVSFVGDALISATFRWLPIDLHGMHYAQTLWWWAATLWVGAALVAGRGSGGTLLLILTGCIAVPALIWGVDRVAPVLFVFFHANPNSAMAWPIGLALALYLHRCFRDGVTPARAVMLCIPPASLFIKANQAPAFAFLQAIAFALWLRDRNARRAVLPLILAAGALWTTVLAGSFTMGAWPPGRGVHPSMENLRHYALVALAVPNTWRQHGLNLWAFLAIVAAIHAAAVDARRRAAGWIPLAALAISVLYIAAAWWAVVPNGLAEGEPMHVNFELIMWIGTALMVDGVWSIRHRWPARAAIGAAAAWCLYAIWIVNTQPEAGGGLVLYPGTTMATIERVRDRLASAIPGGSCFGYGRRYVVDVADPTVDPDEVIAATGCPVLNGRRWRGYLGDNRPEEWHGRATVPAGGGAYDVVQLDGLRPNTAY